MTYTKILLTDTASEYLSELIAKKAEDDWGVRVYVVAGGTPQAETCLSYCRSGNQQADDVLLQSTPFPVYQEFGAEKFLHEAKIDYDADDFGGQLTIKAPHSRLSPLDENSTFEQRVNHVLWNDINPMVASHGGQVSLVEITEQNDVVLLFGGGCQGCGMVDVTLREGIEKTMKEALPELNSIIDSTDHSVKENAYY